MSQNVSMSVKCVCMKEKSKLLVYSRSAFVAGGFLVAQFVLIDLEPNHCPFIAVIALSASCK